MDAIIRSAILTANSVTSPLQVTVEHTRKASSDGWGTTYAPAPETATALWEEKSKLVETPSGQMAEAKHEVTFIQPRDIAYGDKIVGPHGSTGPILRIEGLKDPATGKPYMVQVWLG